MPIPRLNSVLNGKSIMTVDPPTLIIEMRWCEFLAH